MDTTKESQEIMDKYLNKNRYDINEQKDIKGIIKLALLSGYNEGTKNALELHNKINK